MLVPKVLNKTKYKVVNGEIKSDGLVSSEEYIWIDMSNFSQSDIQSLIRAGHTDYFTDSEKETLIESGLISDNSSNSSSSGGSSYLSVVPAVVTVLRGTTATATVTAIARYGGIITLSLISAPSWVSLFGSNVTIAPSPSEAAGTYSVVIRSIETYSSSSSNSSSSSTADVTLIVNVLSPITPT